VSARHPLCWRFVVATVAAVLASDFEQCMLALVWKPLTRSHGTLHLRSRTSTCTLIDLQWQPSSRTNGANSADATCQQLLSSPPRRLELSLDRQLLSRYPHLLDLRQKLLTARNWESTKRFKLQEIASRRVSYLRSRFLGQDQVLRMSLLDLLAHQSSSRRPAQVLSRFGDLRYLQE